MLKRASTLGLAAVVAATLCIQSCEWFNRPEQEPHGIEFCTAVYEDSVNVLDAHAYQSLRVDFPVDEDTSRLAESLVAWLCGEVGACSYPDWSGQWPDDYVNKEEMEHEVQNGSASFPENFVTYFGKKGLDKMREDLQQIAGDGYEGEYYNKLTVELVENEKNYLTFIHHNTIYTGGAHGGQSIYGATFRKSDGSRMDWSMFDPEKRGELSVLLKQGLMAYFTDFNETPVDNDSALFDNLLLFDDPDTPQNELEFGIPLPAAAPWIMRAGFIFMYAEYEIAPYSVGHPFCVIPAEKILPLMTEEGRKWLKSLSYESQPDAMFEPFEERM